MLVITRKHLCGAIWSYREISGAIWSYLELSGALELSRLSYLGYYIYLGEHPSFFEGGGAAVCSIRSASILIWAPYACSTYLVYLLMGFIPYARLHTQMPICSYLGPSGTIWSYLALPGATRSYMELHGVTWSYLELSGPNWRYLQLNLTI